ncbi:MAG: hypothetical protein GC168_01465 [Candidatus Hydrogenedens sp.]|nr:hypothetical protein [Candidatus Hydrogenedens sp.]
MLHLLAALWFLGFAPTIGTGPEPEPEPILLNLVPDDAPPARQLVESNAPPQPPETQTANIAPQSTRAADMMLQEGDAPGPVFFEESDFESLAQPKPTPQSASSAAQAAEEAPQETEKEAPSEEPVDQPPVESAETLPSKAPVPEKADERPEQEPVKMAQATAAPPVETPPSNARGRLHNSVTNEGFTSFEAIQDEVAPYLQHIKRKVEVRWHEGLIRYAGTQIREVGIDCEIDATGALIKAEIYQSSGDVIYDTVCVEAMRKAGPFGAFPFQVPEIYQNKNLEIRWRFSFR